MYFDQHANMNVAQQIAMRIECNQTNAIDHYHATMITLCDNVYVRFMTYNHDMIMCIVELNDYDDNDAIIERASIIDAFNTRRKLTIDDAFTYRESNQHVIVLYDKYRDREYFLRVMNA